MSGLPSASGAPSTLASLHPGAQTLLPGASQREQDLIQRELYSRACMDPSFAHQVFINLPLALSAARLLLSIKF